MCEFIKRNLEKHTLYEKGCKHCPGKKKFNNVIVNTDSNGES